MAALNPKFFFISHFAKIIVLMCFGVYAWTPYFLLIKGVAYDALLPYEAAFFIGLSFISFVWIIKLVVEMLRK